ncbi:MAG: hypothetical protein HY854_06675 [Burkholderiales bacterium]|nr:hypothetical protein [Burkholderiales bacterium]
MNGNDAPPAWEWLVGLLGLVLVLSALGYLLAQALDGERVPPSPEVRVTGIHAHDGGYTVVVRVHNRSESTAAGLKIEGTLTQDGRQVEQSGFDLPYLAGHSTREGGLYFKRDPRSLQLDVRAKGYEKP